MCIAGDISYADYWLKEEINGYLPNTTIAGGVQVYELMLNEYYNEMTILTKDRPYMVGPGNHESNCKVLPRANMQYTRLILCRQ
jgi:hypothetical protein